MPIDFVDRVPTYANRVRIVPESGAAYYATMERADSPVENGTPLNAETFNNMQAELHTRIDGSMPKSGGVFSGAVSMDSANRSGDYLRNVSVRTGSPTGAQQSTSTIIMVRK